MTPHRITSSLCLFLSFPRFYVCMGITLACIWNFAKIILACINYFHNYVSDFMKKIPFSRSVELWHAYPYSTCRQVKISFLGMPQIAHFQVEKWKSSLPWEGWHLPPTPSPRSVAATLPRKDCAPPPQKCFGSLRHCVGVFSYMTDLAAKQVENNNNSNNNNEKVILYWYISVRVTITRKHVE